MSTPSFKPYHQHQLSLLPPSLEELIAPTHSVRVVSRIIDGLDLSVVEAQYSKLGSHAYHPRMLLKVLVYGYLSNIYSSRKLEASCREQVHFMWLSGMQQPDHHTINRFRTERLGPVVKTVFSQVVLLLHESGHLDLQRVFVDGTKVEANANRYSFVWGRALQTNKKRMMRQLEELWNYAQSVAKEEQGQGPMAEGVELEPQAIAETLERIHGILKADGKRSAKQREKANYAKRTWPGKLEEYQKREEQLGDRNSCSKTDPDATFMRMKEDHMRNGQLKLGYNIQVSSNDQYIIDYSVHQSSTDSGTLKPHLQSHQQLYGGMPEQLIADAGYGNEENYHYLEEAHIEGYVKDNYYDRDRNKTGKKGKAKRRGGRDVEFASDQLPYDPMADRYTCPMGQPMELIGKYKRMTASGWQSEVSRYQARRCKGCPLRSSCHGQKGNRVIEVSHQRRRLKEQMRKRLDSEQGQQLLHQRGHDVETVFAQIKHNKNYKRCMLRGTDKVAIEWGLLAMAHNLAKLARAA